MTLRSRNTSGESPFLSSDERTTRTNQRRAASNKEVGSVTTKTREKIGKRKYYRRKKRQRAFKNTIVLAPFYALKECCQNKLKDMYKKGLLESNAKRVKIPNKSLFQYDVMEMRANQSEKVERGSKKRKSEKGDYCHCEEQKKTGVNPEPGTSQSDKASPPKAKKQRTRTPAGKKSRSVRQSRGKRKEGDNRRSKTQPKKTPDKKRSIKYKTRSVTRKETAQRDEDGKQTDTKTPNEQKEGDSSRGFALAKSNSSVIFLEEIKSPNAESPAKPEETVAAVTQMFDSILKSTGEDVGKKLRSTSGSRKPVTRSCSSDHRQEEDSQKEIEANVVVQEHPNPPSSSSEDAAPASSSKSLPHKPDKSASYIFGPKCPYQGIRESCEYGFGMSKTTSDEEVDDGGNIDVKKHR